VDLRSHKIPDFDADLSGGNVGRWNTRVITAYTYTGKRFIQMRTFMEFAKKFKQIGEEEITSLPNSVNPTLGKIMRVCPKQSNNQKLKNHNPNMSSILFKVP
jgi:hypothetical protein